MAQTTSIKPGFFGDIAEEMRKVSWPTRQQTIRLTFIVVAISLIIGTYIGTIDILLTKVLELLTRTR